MDKVVAPDGRGIAVAHDDDHLELGVGQLHARGKGECTAVRGVECIDVHVNGQPPGTADPGDQDDFVLFVAAAVNGANQRAQKDAIAASRAPDMRELLVVPEVFVNQLCSPFHQKPHIQVGGSTSWSAGRGSRSV